MSHFTVLIVGDNAEEQLAPFDENDREQFTDEEEDYLKEYNEKTTESVVFSDGRIYTKYCEEMKRYWKRANIGISSNDEFLVPHNAEIKEVPMNQIYKTFESFMKDWHGMERDEEFDKYGSRRNPKAKWDWYQLGGRWTGFFQLKNNNTKGASLNQDHIDDLAKRYGITRSTIKSLVMAINKGSDATDEFTRANPIAGGYQLEKEIKGLLTLQYPDAKVGSSGLMTDLAKPGRVDSAKIKDIDFEGMIQQKGTEARNRYETLEILLGGSIPKLEILWSDMIAKEGAYSHLDIESKRLMYHSQKAKRVVETARERQGLTKDEKSMLTWVDLEDYQVSKEEYIKRAENNALSTFAILKDGEWYEKGEMGWFGMSHDTMTQDQWNEEFMKLLKSLDGETVISVYDCHI